jgi:hypothetical protein
MSLRLVAKLYTRTFLLMIVLLMKGIEIIVFYKASLEMKAGSLLPSNLILSFSLSK